MSSLSPFDESDSQSPKPNQKITWKQAIHVYRSRPVITMFFLGYASGLPILLVFSTLSIWLREVEVSRADIGYFSWILLAYGMKFLWAPAIDAVRIPILSRLLGRRKGWMFLSQLAVISSILAMAFNDPAANSALTALFAAFLAFSGATQDIVIDAYRLESADDDYQGAMAATYTAGYRLAMVLAGAGALEIAGLLDIYEGEGLAGYDYNAWKWSYIAMAGAMVVSLITTLIIREPEPVLMSKDKKNDPWKVTVEEKLSAYRSPILKSFFNIFYHIIWPIVDFVQRYRTHALLILTLIATYRISDIVMGVMANVFYTDLGFEKQEIGRINKVFGLIVTIGGTFLGGLFVRKFGVLSILLLGAVLSAASNLIFAFLAYQNVADINGLIVAIIVDNISAGIASAAFIAYLSSLANREFSATQYALFTSIMLLLPKVLGGYSGVMVDSIGYSSFFIGTAIIGVPVVILILIVKKVTQS